MSTPTVEGLSAALLKVTGEAAAAGSLRHDLLEYIDGKGLHLGEWRARHDHLVQLPDELFTMADAMSSKGSDSPLAERLGNLKTVTVEVLKLAEGRGAVDDFARRFAMPLALVEDMHAESGEAEAPPAPTPDPLTFAEARPDVMLAKLADEIQAEEGCTYGEALQLAEERDPVLAFRYRDAPYLRKLSKPVRIEPPRGLRLCETRPDVELAERAKSRATADGSSYAAAEALVLAENPKLASRYHDRRTGENALDELTYRVATIREQSQGRVSERKATDAALAEDPVLREAVMAYFERDPYTSPE
jgi:hypothetical protein